MSGLKEIKSRIKSVKSSQKITKAMQMVAAAKFRKARIKLEEAEASFERTGAILSELSKNIEPGTKFPKQEIVYGRNEKENGTHLVVVVTSDRGLCGAFNGGLIKKVKEYVHNIETIEKKKIKLFFIGKKGYELMKNHPAYFNKIMHHYQKTENLKDCYEYDTASDVINYVFNQFDRKEFDSCSIIYNKFVSAISQTVNVKHLIPLQKDDETLDLNIKDLTKLNKKKEKSHVEYEFEPNAEEILSDIVEQVAKTKLFETLLESYTSEQGSRMTAMDNASRNASEMIKDLTLLFNRTRQATITKELIEIISGAEAV